MIKKLLVFLLSSFLFLPLSCGSKKEFSDLIISVHDGDTFYTKNRTIRLFGIDTPEITNEFKSASIAEEIYGEAARDFTANLILNKVVTIKNITSDKYSREVDQIFIGQIDLALCLLKSGLARVAYFSIDPKNPFYNSDYAYYEKLLNAQLEAFKTKVGIWKSNLAFKEIFPKA